MKAKYTPILRWKTGERNCLENLAADISNNIMPFIEVALPAPAQDEDATKKKIEKLITTFNLSWERKPFYLYLSEDWYSEADSPSQIPEIYSDFFKRVNHPKAIPAFDITDMLNICAVPHLTTDNGICLRISGSNFEAIRDTLNGYVHNSWIIPETTDLLLDLRYVTDDTYPAKSALAAVVADIPNIATYRRIIIASCSFPKDVSNLLPDVVNEFTRHEVAIHAKALELQKTYGFNYVYADYGPMNLNDTAFVLGMIPNFKIKYTTCDKYLIVRGISLKKGGLDLNKVASCCMQLVSHPQYSGMNFSHGDRIISDTANGINIKSGNLTSWVGYSFNHHITLIVSWL